MKTMITDIGYSKLKEKAGDLRQRKKDVLAEMQEVKETCLSSDDDSELIQYRIQVGTLDDQIQELTSILENIKIIDVTKISTDKVYFGAVVVIEDIDTEEKIEYRIVSVHESDPKNGMISIASPLGKALCGSSVGDVVDLQTPNGDKEYEVLSIEAKEYSI